MQVLCLSKKKVWHFVDHVSMSFVIHRVSLLGCYLCPKIGSNVALIILRWTTQIEIFASLLLIVTCDFFYLKWILIWAFVLLSIILVSNVSANMNIPVLNENNIKKWKKHVMIVLIGYTDRGSPLKVDRPVPLTSSITIEQKVVWWKIWADELDDHA